MSTSSARGKVLLRDVRAIEEWKMVQVCVCVCVCVCDPPPRTRSRACIRAELMARVLARAPRGGRCCSMRG